MVVVLCLVNGSTRGCHVILPYIVRVSRDLPTCDLHWSVITAFFPTPDGAPGPDFPLLCLTSIGHMTDHPSPGMAAGDM